MSARVTACQDDGPQAAGEAEGLAFDGGELVPDFGGGGGCVPSSGRALGAGMGAGGVAAAGGRAAGCVGAGDTGSGVSDRDVRVTADARSSGTRTGMRPRDSATTPIATQAATATTT